ncbi:MAG: D-alanyl-D-alanine carboxypeptidase family protein [Butyricicoccaceae bacterium]
MKSCGSRCGSARRCCARGCAQCGGGGHDGCGHGETLFAENADSRLPMASTTKIVTALVALGEGGLDRVYTVKKQYAAVEGSSMYLEEGERLTLRDTLYGLMLSSGNDAAAAVAGECGGERAFVDKMNAKARELGLTDTRFENPSGLPSDGHYTTARELAKITAAALLTRCSATSCRRRPARPPAARSSTTTVCSVCTRTRSASRPALHVLPGAVWCRQLSGTAGRSSR